MDNKGYCKKCLPFMHSRLEQTGNSDPKSYRCVICGSTHNDDLELYIEPENLKPITTMGACSKCGSEDVYCEVCSYNEHRHDRRMIDLVVNSVTPYENKEMTGVISDLPILYPIIYIK
jgi:hypothetical protein